MSVAQQTFQSPTQNQSSVQNNLQKPKLLLRTYTGISFVIFFYYYYFSIWAIMSKVRIEAFCWGAGTALGELPPYFMARAHRLSGYDSDEEEDEYDELQEKIANQEEMVIFYLIHGNKLRNWG